MKHLKTFFFILSLVVLAGCQSNVTEKPDASPSPVVEVSGMGEDFDLDTARLEADLGETGVEVSLDGSVEQPFFSVPGRILTVNNEPVQVFEYADSTLADGDAGQVASDGSSIGTTMATWVGPAHFFRAERLIVLYVGNSPAVLDALESILGSQFAGAGTAQGPSMDAEPPAASLIIGDQEQSSGIGSYCWPGEGGGTALCVDKVGLPTPVDPLQVNSPFDADFNIPIPDLPDALTLSAIAVTSDDQMESNVDGMRWWQPKPGDSYKVPVQPPYQLGLTLEPGLYVFSLFAQWQDLGDASYGFLVDVMAAEGAGSPVGSPDVVYVEILAEAGLNLRNAPGIDSEVVGLIPYQEIVNATGQSPDGGWWQIACTETESGECWISADPTLSAPTNMSEMTSSLAGLIYSRIDQQPERPLWRVGADGIPVKFLDSSTDFGGLSADGKQVVTHLAQRGETNLYLVDIDTGERTQLTDTAERINFNPQWWPANPDSIVFISRSFNPNDLPQPGPGNLAMVKTDGTGFQLLDEEHLTHTFIPGLSPDGQTIAYNVGGENASEDGIFTPWLYHLEDGPEPFDYAAYGFTPVPDLSFGRASWSPDGRFLAWVIAGELSGEGTWQVGIAIFDTVAGSVAVIKPFVPGDGIFVTGREPPIWSPDNEWLTWNVYPQGGLPSFWIMKPDGSEAQLIDHASPPIWSPDGDLLVYMELSTGANMVMKTGVWQPQRTALPSQIGYIAWIRLEE